MKNNTKIKVVDSIMGQGKTTWAIDFMKENPDDRFMYITPYLDEVRRVKEEVNTFIEPKAIKGSKLNHMKQLIEYGSNIASTHSLMGRFDIETQKNINMGEYTLILDECSEVVTEHTFMTEADKEDFFKYYAYVEDGYVKWNEEAHPVEEYIKGSNFYEEMVLCLNGNLVYINEKLLLWELPVNVFKAFKEVYILTYMFEGSVQKPYFDLYDIDYEYLSVKQGKLIPYEKTSKEMKLEIASLITLVENDKLNSIGDDKFALSSTWLRNNVKQSGKVTVMADRLKKNTENYFKNIAKTKAQDNMWSIYDKYYNRVRGIGYGKKDINYVEYNVRATNKYQHKKALAYLINVFPHTSLTMYFSQRDGLKDINIDIDKFALSALIQWVWRSRIRRQDLPHQERTISLYLPSHRMRTIFKEWLDS